MADSAEVVSQHAHSHGAAARVPRKIRHVALDFGVQVHAVCLNEFQKRRCGEGFGNAGDAERHRRIRGKAGLPVGESGSFSKNGTPPMANTDRDRCVLLAGLKLG
jgi:hypothetical protein